MNSSAPKNKYVVMLIGKTHTGKTTFAKELKLSIKDLIILEADPIAVFMKAKFPELRAVDDLEHTGKFKNVSAKFQIFKILIDLALTTGRPVIFSNGNLREKWRKAVVDLSRKYDRKVIGVYLNY